MGIFGQERVYSSEVPGPEDLSKPFCPAGLVELRNALAKELDDEKDAASKYRDSGIKLLHFQRPKLAAKLAAISDDEARHHKILEEMVKQIDKECGCGEKGEG